eukprot:1917981-Lingulodinium_polyedra.AAC.1
MGAICAATGPPHQAATGRCARRQQDRGQSPPGAGSSRPGAPLFAILTGAPHPSGHSPFPSAGGLL